MFLGSVTVLLNSLKGRCSVQFARTARNRWAIWVYWLSPYAWSIRAIVCNEMTTPEWQVVAAKSLNDD
jgi:hypothetical protein